MQPRLSVYCASCSSLWPGRDFSYQYGLGPLPQCSSLHAGILEARSRSQSSCTSGAGLPGKDSPEVRSMRFSSEAKAGTGSQRRRFVCGTYERMVPRLANRLTADVQCRTGRADSVGQRRPPLAPSVRRASDRPCWRVGLIPGLRIGFGARMAAPIGSQLWTWSRLIDAGGSGNHPGTRRISRLWRSPGLLGPRRASMGATRRCRLRFPGIMPFWFYLAPVLTLVGWLGLNCAGAILFAEPAFRRSY